MPAIAKGLVSLKKPEEILLLKHPFDPIPLRDMFARRGFSSWAEERKAGEWFIYFYHPSVSAKAKAHYSVNHKTFAKPLPRFEAMQKPARSKGAEEILTSCVFLHSSKDKNIKDSLNKIMEFF